MAARKPLIAGNWKMYGRASDLAEIERLAETIGAAARAVDALICPPLAYVQSAAWRARGKPILIGAQDCSTSAGDAARTGDVSAAMLADAGASHVIVGHSERRAIFGETDATVSAKAKAAMEAGLTPIVCVGETQAEREGGRVGEVIAAQVRASVPAAGAHLVVAYEPVWAIGGARTPTPDEIAEVHALIGETLRQTFGADANAVRILYGGSVGPKNAAQVFSAAGVDGALVGRASLKASDFSAIILAHPAAG